MNKITPFKDRTIDLNTEVKVYRNLLKKGVVYSIQQNNLVVGHAKYVSLEKCTCEVNYVTQARIRRKKVKEVHAYVTGMITTDVPKTDCEVKYNPYQHNDFFTVAEEVKTSITGADYMFFGSNGVKASNVKYLNKDLFG